MSVDWTLSFLFIQRFQKWDRNVKENPKVRSTSPLSQTAAPVSSERSFIRHLGVTQFHKQSLPRLTRYWHQQLQRVTPPQFHSFLRSGRKRAKFSLAALPRRETQSFKWAVAWLRWYFPGNKLLFESRHKFPWRLSQGDISSPGLLSPGTNRFCRKSHSAAQLCFSLRPFPHT